MFPVFGIRDGKCDCGETCSSPGKHPRVKDWQGWATDDLAKLRTSAKSFGGCNLGIACGQSGIFVLDMDPAKGGDESLKRLERQHGALPQTWVFLTGGGGRHIVFRDPGVELDLRNSASKLGPGLDTRGHGGFIVAPQSRHISGRSYAISVDHHPDEFALADLPAWLLTLLTQVNGHKLPTPAEEWRALMEADLGEGIRDDTMTRLAGYMLRRWIDPYVVAGLLRSFNHDHCRPPLPDHDIDRIVASIARKESARRVEFTNEK